MPPTTSLSDCLWLLGMSIAVGSAFYLLGWTGMARSIAMQRFKVALSLGKTPRTVDPAIATDVIRDYSRSFAAFVLCWLPWLGLVAGNIGVSLLRDAGFVIFPWIIMITGVLFIAGVMIAARLKFLRLSRMLPTA